MTGSRHSSVRPALRMLAALVACAVSSACAPSDSGEKPGQSGGSGGTAGGGSGGVSGSTSTGGAGTTAAGAAGSSGTGAVAGVSNAGASNGGAAGASAGTAGGGAGGASGGVSGDNSGGAGSSGSGGDASGGAGAGAGGVAGADMAGTGGQGGEPPDPGTEGDGDFEIGPNYTPQPDVTDRGAPKGRSFQFSMALEDSMIFDGTDDTLDPNKPVNERRTISVYVPAQYQAALPAPVLVIQDGPGELDLVKNALDNLTIAEDPERRIPAFIAVAVQNGGNDSKGSERGLEYDTMSDRYARFIDLEVLPAVEANSAIRAEYPDLTFTTDPQGRATIGCSSGGAAALSMGWFRPDLFGRIITYSGTFVDQQDDDAAEEATYPLGAWEYHSGQELIANEAKKPLRIFLNVNENDLGANDPESTHHNWVMANERTAAALAEKGYHYRYVFARGASHCDGRVRSATLADSLIWVWRGYQPSGT